MEGTVAFDDSRDALVRVIAKLVGVGEEGKLMGLERTVSSKEPTLRVNDEPELLSGQLAVSTRLLSLSRYTPLLGSTPNELEEIKRWTHFALDRLGRELSTRGELESQLKALNAHLFRPFLVGGRITMADIALFSCLEHNLDQISPTRYPSVVRLLGTVEHFLRHPTVEQYPVLTFDPNLHRFVAMLSELSASTTLVKLTVKGGKPTLKLSSDPHGVLHGQLAIATALLSNSPATPLLGTLSDRPLVESWVSYSLNKLLALVEAGGTRLQEELKNLEATLSTRSFFVSSTLTIADIAFYVAVFPIVTSLNVTSTPSILRLFDTVQFKIRKRVIRTLHPRGEKAPVHKSQSSIPIIDVAYPTNPESLPSSQLSVTRDLQSGSAKVDGDSTTSSTLSSDATTPKSSLPQSAPGVLTFDRSLDHFLAVVSDISGVGVTGTTAKKPGACLVSESRIPGTTAMLTFSTTPVTAFNDPLSISTFLIQNSTLGERTPLGQKLLGGSTWEKAEVASWTRFSVTRLRKALVESEEQRKATLKILDDFLTTRAFVISNHLTLADVALYTTLYPFAGSLATLNVPSVLRVFDTVQHQIRQTSITNITAAGANPCSPGCHTLPIIEFELEKTSKPNLERVGKDAISTSWQPTAETRTPASRKTVSKSGTQPVSAQVVSPKLNSAIDVIPGATIPQKKKTEKTRSDSRPASGAEHIANGVGPTPVNGAQHVPDVTQTNKELPTSTAAKVVDTTAETALVAREVPRVNGLGLSSIPLNGADHPVGKVQGLDSSPEERDIEVQKDTVAETSSSTLAAAAEPSNVSSPLTAREPSLPDILLPSHFEFRVGKIVSCSRSSTDESVFDVSLDVGDLKTHLVPARLGSSLSEAKVVGRDGRCVVLVGTEGSEDRTLRYLPLAAHVKDRTRTYVSLLRPPPIAPLGSSVNVRAFQSAGSSPARSDLTRWHDLSRSFFVRHDRVVCYKDVAGGSIEFVTKGGNVCVADASCVNGVLI
ncbi:hypothetical protein M427DRAFT_433897 [Gonapodya prolifera JEL478]|uniref:Glutathione S-transferase C-terminal domain-containing protein n=1 Tax=Gonapodya prolifera (strain JEL478) TaxID=1344416 RepID=A0A139ATA9_GONPJ|nr:hypothetical protein M427DRAFT_433897 [Gonapodya prolifera JEL478]|eukprot:KXS19956.1 hypothetical protein M427DRAFT_433897 [Gonapodya prolifera JEL478]